MTDEQTAQPSTARITYRVARARDAADQAEVFYHAVMQGAATRYSLAQRRAWASALPREASAWSARQALYTTLVASCDGRCVGFIELDVPAGRVETLYVWPSLNGRGIGTTLLIHAERWLLEQGVSRIQIEASLTLYERLLRRGWENLGEQWVERGGEPLQRFRLQKRLNAVET
ncbi:MULTISPECIES: GNAT family N-acetyltransferase [Halomonadaceae]|jgi:putative acetyltransferase|uniref:GNAT family N-acetyltransferase n=1 Tax=Vreelandella janggokensis TaxID=370767 RepID=A0ABT4IVT1_9GAMM|nr:MULTISPECIES: GNAT family N-acetyltransferase [Halomonas]MCW4149041.1 GNAT family N-acetyltransferase [Halomonas sp. 18H]MCZ0927778.1 GNAT family N-acetyltransferase [Halomonas janggokensis]MCZ0930764.1 GNAT family N-acetyltransferase [Halomonas janggokensis]MDR5884431.1 GNAT family N-acetyltransferase [Halomonas janggokensis]QPL45519.1 GNAT family N-acetyltransferase [Halomonas sp. A40-4]